MNEQRAAHLREIEAGQWDVLILGGGASGLGTAVEAATRGLRTLLVERDDFAKGTSSRSTKLVHGGVRYLEQMNVTLVLDALRERGYMLRNAPHLVHKLSFVVPIYEWFGMPYYGVGLKAYELLSGKLSFGSSSILSKAETKNRLKTVVDTGLKGGIQYWDGQFDDARYAIALMRTFEDNDGVALNHVSAVKLIDQNGKVAGAEVEDSETGQRYLAKAKIVINATGAFTEAMLRMDNPNEAPVLSISQGTHFVLDQEFLPSADALMIPKTADGRVLFAIPWHEKLVVGTTDVGVPQASREPHATKGETDFLVEHIEKYMGHRVKPSEVRSMWSGLRPLVRDGNASGATSKLSRDHRVIISKTGLVTLTGGKWTTYRKMGEDTINKATAAAGVTAKPSVTVGLKLHGAAEESQLKMLGADDAEKVYGSELGDLRALGASEEGLDARIHDRLPYRWREVVWAARYEKARTTEDVLSRRMRALFLDSAAASEAAPDVARLLGRELGRSDEQVAQDAAAFQAVAAGYRYNG